MGTPQNGLVQSNESSNPETQSCHPNGKTRTGRLGMKRPTRDDKLLFEDVFPDTRLGKLLKGLLVTFLTKQEHRMGWARKAACDGLKLESYPNETVASHQWGVASLIMAISRDAKFKEELPNFNKCRAYEMAMIHDVAELETGDITPVDGISVDEKHRLESEAMQHILGCFPDDVRHSLHDIYCAYEDRECCESKFVKDCDKLDFMIYAFLLERQGFSGFEEFYTNSGKDGFSTKIATELADLLVKTRFELAERNLLFRKNC